MYVTTKSKIIQNYHMNKKTEVYGVCEINNNRAVTEWSGVKEPAQ
jgi:hypothetical protein